MNNTLITLLIASLAAVVAWKLKPDNPPPPAAPPLVTVQEMGTLASLKVNYSNVVEINDKVALGIPWTQWQLLFGGTQVLLIARGDCLIGTDLKIAIYEQRSDAAKSITLALPKPKVVSARLNHEPNNGGSHFYTVSSTGVVALVPGNDAQVKAMNLALEKAQGEIAANCARPELIEAARKSAEAVLLPTVSATGWKVAIVWR